MPGSTVTLSADSIRLEFTGFGHSRSKRRASPRTIPLGAIDGVDRSIAPVAGYRYIRLLVRGQAARAVYDDPNTFATISADVSVDPFLAALEAAIARAPRVDDFEPDRRRGSAGHGNSGLVPRQSPLLDWMQGW